MLPPVIIVHYHLQPGGVTRVIESQVDALNEAGVDYLILTGELYSGDRGVKQAVIPDLSYKDSSPFLNSDGKVLYEECKAAVKERFGTQEVIWLIHNPTLGKNILFPALIKHLVQNQQKLLFLCHDFAEDGRPSNFQTNQKSEHLYPLSSNVHYAFINSRDHRLIVKAGLPPQRAHLLPNAVLPPKIERDNTVSEKSRVLYPVRGIRRKNVGEFLLWSALAPENTEFALTLAPKNEKWVPYYQIWESLVKELDLPVYLQGTNGKSPNDTKTFKEWLEEATHCFTTSISEGFGLTFLEPTASQIPLIGRDLPEITSDFTKEGISMGRLYQRLLVPLSAVDALSLKQELYDALETSYLSYQQPFKERYLEEAWNLQTKDDMVDFGNLPEHHQLSLILKIKKEGFKEFYVLTSSGKKVKAEKWLKDSLSIKTALKDELSSHTLEAYRERLISLIENMSDQPADEPTWLNREDVLKEFLTPERFNFLKT